MSDVSYLDTPAPPASESDQAEAARSGAAGRMARGTLRGDKTPDTALPTVGDQESYDKVKPGSFYLDPQGNKRKRLYEVKGEEDYAAIPEGEDYTDPEGNTRSKPTSSPISVTSQLLYNMATNDRERKKALEQSYPGKVTQEGKEWLIDDDGTLRKPKGMTETIQGLAGGLGAAAAPTIGAIAGEIGGGIIGSLPGAILGGAGGAMVGQTFNDSILALSGIYDRSVGEQAAETAIAGGVSAGGTMVGRAAGVTAGIKGMVEGGIPYLAAKFLGAEPQSLAAIMAMKEKGLGLVGPSTWAKEAPHLQQITETLDPALRTQQPLRQSMEKYYEEQANELLETAGVKLPGWLKGPETKLLEPEAKVSSRAAGQQLLDKTSAELVVADEKIAAEFAARKASLEAGAANTPSRSGLETIAQEARTKAKAVVDATFQELERDVDDALKLGKSGHNNGDLWQMVGDRLKAIYTGIMSRSQKFYQDAYQVAGGHSYATAELAQDADAFLKQVPEEFAKAYPALIGKLQRLAGKTSETGEVLKEGVDQLTLSEAHQMRTIMRNAADWYTLPSDFKNGSLKFFAGKLDGLIQNVPKGSEAETAVRMLNATDEWYADQVKVFNARNVKTVMDGLKAGEPADPTALRNVIVKAGHSDLTQKLMDMIGPSLASGVRAADTKAMLQTARTANPGEIDAAKFAHEVVGRYQDDVLHVIHGKDGGDRLLKQAQDILALEGKLTVKALPGDTARDIVMKAQAAKEAADAASKADPIRVLEHGVRKLEAEQKKAVTAARDKISDGPLNFLYNAEYGAMKAADNILASEDLLFAAEGKFGRQSPEFQALQKVWLQRLLTGDMDVGAKLLKYSPEAQNLMAPPGVSVSQIQTLAKEMQLLMSQRGVGGTGASIMAQHAVAHPQGYLPTTGHSRSIKWIASTAVGRKVLTDYTSFVLELMNKPWLLRKVVQGLEGDAAAKQMTREQIKRWTRIGGAVGAGGAESQVATPEQ